MEELKENISKQTLASQRKFLEDLLKRRYFYSIAFDIYGGFSGLYDFGPSGCAIKNNVEQLWREHFILEEDMLEINSTSLVPDVVLINSGHVEKFADYMVKDLKTGQCFRADKLIEEHTEKLLVKDQKEKKLTEEQKQNLIKIQNDAGDYDKLQLQEAINSLKIKNPETGNDLSEPLEFNLMFKTNIGPTGNQQGYLRPETAQGIFVNFAKLLEFNQQKMPFAAAIVGTGYRNEIAPRSGLLRAREFPMAEIEHFVDPQNKSHSKFCTVENLQIQLLPADIQQKGEHAIKISLKEALSQKIIQNETVGYFLGRTYLFLVSVGVNANNIRFRQHREKEMAHYAKDCWDAEIEMSYGWIECVGIADRAAFDLDRHTKGSKTNLVAARKFKEPTLVKFISLQITKQGKQTLGSLYKKDSQILFCHLEKLQNQEKEELKVYLEANSEKQFQLEGKEFILKKEYVQFEAKEQNVTEEKYIPNVIEPSFGIGRILYAIFEHSFRMRDQKRTYLHLPPRIAPVKCSILTVISIPEFQPYIIQLKKQLIQTGISSKVDDGSQTIGRRYARTDEIGIPFGITIDNKTLTEQTVTLREQETTKQIRIDIKEVVSVLAKLIDGSLLWSDVLKQYPIFEAQPEQNE